MITEETFKITLGEFFRDIEERFVLMGVNNSTSFLAS